VNRGNSNADDADAANARADLSGFLLDEVVGWGGTDIGWRRIFADF
jgi:hypothetical protein